MDKLVVPLGNMYGCEQLCTKSPVRNLTQQSIGTFWSHFGRFSRSKSPILYKKSTVQGYFWCKAGVSL
jgi:hypothetical protein